MSYATTNTLAAEVTPQITADTQSVSLASLADVIVPPVNILPLVHSMGATVSTASVSASAWPVVAQPSTIVATLNGAMSSIQSIMATPVRISSISATSVQIAQAAAIQAIRTAPITVDSPAATVIQQQVERIAATTSVQAVTRQMSQATKVIQAEASRIYTNQVSIAVTSAASFATGVDVRQVITESGRDGVTRVIAVDKDNRGVVAEIVTDKAGNVSLQTEVVGIHDGRCKEIIAKYEKVLQDKGIIKALGKKTWKGSAMISPYVKDLMRKRTSVNNRASSGTAALRK